MICIKHTILTIFIARHCSIEKQTLFQEEEEINQMALVLFLLVQSDRKKLRMSTEQ